MSITHPGKKWIGAAIGLAVAYYMVDSYNSGKIAELLLYPPNALGLPNSIALPMAYLEGAVIGYYAAHLF